MGDRGLLAALFTGVAALAVSLLGSWIRPQPLPAPPAEPVVGRTLQAIEAGPDPRFVTIRKSTAAEREQRRLAAEIAAWDARLGDRPLPAFARSVVIHPHAGALPASDAEEGPPWHLLLEEGGAIRLLPRYERGRPGLPPGQRAKEARQVLHVAVPFATRMPQARRETLRGLCRHLRRKMSLDGAAGILPADRVPGSEASPVPGFPYELLQASASEEK